MVKSGAHSKQRLAFRFSMLTSSSVQCINDTSYNLHDWYELFALHNNYRSKLFTSVSVAKEHADRYVTTQGHSWCLWTRLWNRLKNAYVINKETFCMLNKNSWTNLKIAIHILGTVRFRGFLLLSTFSLGYIAWHFPELPQMGHRISLSPHFNLHLFVLTFYCHKKYMILRVSYLINLIYLI